MSLASNIPEWDWAATQETMSLIGLDWDIMTQEVRGRLSEDGAEEALNELAHQARLWIQHRTLGPHVRKIVPLTAIGTRDCKMYHNR